MRQAKLSVNFVPFSDSEFLFFAEGIHSAMLNNSFYPNPLPGCTDLQLAITDYNRKLIKAKEKSIIAISYKKEARKNLQFLLTQMAQYVMFVANGDEVMLTSSGFHLTKVPEKSYIKPPETPKVTIGISSGELVSCVKAISGAKCYLHEITTAPLTDESIWQTHNSSRRKYTFRNLTPGQCYYIRVVAMGSGQQKAIGDAMAHFSV